MSHENALQWQEVTRVHGARNGECGRIPESKEEPVEDEFGDVSKGLTMQDPAPVKKFHLYPKSKESHGWNTNRKIRFTY